MSIPSLDVHKVVKCAEHKKALDAISLKLKNNIIDSSSEYDFLGDTIIFNKDKKNRLTLKLSTYELELIFKETLLVIDEAPVLKFAAIDPTDENNNELIDLFLSKGGFIYIREYKSEPHYEYGDTSLFLHILDATLKELKSANNISY